ncbi:hypothetical protein Tco_0729067 [Tanacetum coccineum]|uniref:Uncharacterized protein n=1 Tax=Tanacetum coccineum TaxID=301880 RepID=A0ABQ4YQ85_9ASTR
MIKEFQSVKRKTSKYDNWESQGKRQGSGFNKSTNTPVSKSLYVLKEDNGNSIDDLVDDTRKKVEVPPKKTDIRSSRKAERSIAFSQEMKFHYFERDVLEFADRVVEEAEHENVHNKHG